ncbi:MAG TPA: PilZ domain-containing protein [Thermodesulfobacteriota bacterium]|nr:PilZ domain-containing protein [Thermodesulfobacteriota bacterium]
MNETKEAKSHYGIVNFERRRFPRFSIDLPIEYYRTDSGIRFSGRALNASEGGLLVYLPEKVEIGETLRLKLFFTFGHDLIAIEVVAQVAWIDIHLGEEWGDYRSGLKFVDISSEDLNRLKNFLKNLSE